MKKSIQAVLMGLFLLITCSAYAVEGVEAHASFGKVVVNSYEDPDDLGGMFGFQMALPNVSPNLKLSVDFINEGNPKNSVKRDGIAARALYRLPVDMFSGRLKFSIGAGLYAYCSTEKKTGTDGSQFLDRHGIALLVTPLEIRYDFSENWATTVSFHRVVGHKDVNGNSTDTDGVFAGLNYKFH